MLSSSGHCGRPPEEPEGTSGPSGLCVDPALGAPGPGLSGVGWRGPSGGSGQRAIGRLRAGKLGFTADDGAAAAAGAKQQHPHRGSWGQGARLARRPWISARSHGLVRL